MDDNNRKVGNLTKVSVLLEAGTGPGVWDLTRDPVSYDFVYGVGTHGLSPFEIKLANRREGDEVVVSLSREEMPDFFCHHLIPQSVVSEGVETFYFKVRIVGIRGADQREIIKAMAEAAACGGGCCGH